MLTFVRSAANQRVKCICDVGGDKLLKKRSGKAQCSKGCTGYAAPGVTTETSLETQTQHRHTAKKANQKLRHARAGK